jgi:predicted RNase H-like nuclease (RuvC/YqgF family)
MSELDEILKKCATMPGKAYGAIATIAEFIKQQEEKILRLRAELDNFNRDEEISKLKGKIATIREKSLYISLSNKELESYNNFTKKHWEECKGSTKVIIEGSGLGDCISLECTKCHTVEDITDVDSW